MHLVDESRMSLSARRAWIEIDGIGTLINEIVPVALRKESVDRNTSLLAVLKSLSVALRKESVDRNIGGAIKKSV